MYMESYVDEIESSIAIRMGKVIVNKMLHEVGA